MNFLAPLFLLGAAAVAAPVVFHLIRRNTRDRTPFSSLMFLQPSPPQLSRRHRLEHLLLLLLRCAVLVLLAFGFARPFFPAPPAAPAGSGTSVRRVLLVDVSASMRREGVWQQAVSALEAQLRRAAPQDVLAVFTFDRQASALMSFDEWRSAAVSERVAISMARMRAIAPGWGATNLAEALTTAAEALSERDPAAPAARTEIVLISDIQEGSRVAGLQGYDWPADVHVSVEAVSARRVANAGVSVAGEPADAAQAAARAVRVRVTNSAIAKAEQFHLAWAGPEGVVPGMAPISAYVPAGQSRVFPLAAPAASGTRNAADRVVLRGDEEGFDNTAYIVPPAQQSATVLWLGPAPVADPRSPWLFLRRAYSDTPRLAVRVVNTAPDGSGLALQLAAADLTIVGQQPSPAAVGELRSAIEQGRTALLVLPREGGGEWVGTLAGTVPLALQEIAPQSYTMFGEIDFRHPLFAPFADPRFSDFSKIHVWRYRRVDPAGLPNAHVLARFDSGDPAVLEVPVGKGRLIIFATGWQPEDSQLAVSSKFVPLLWSLLEMAGVNSGVPLEVHVGDAVAVPRGAMAVRRPGGAVTALSQPASAFTETAEPGVYEFVGTERSTRFVVNLDPNESRTAPMTADEIERLGVPVGEDEAAKARQPALAALRAAELEGRQKLWRWLIAAALAFVLAESAVAGWTARRGRPLEQEASS